MNWFERHLTSSIFIGVFLWVVITLPILIWVGEQEGWIIFGAIPAALVGYEFGVSMERSRIGKKERKAKEDARSMIESKSRLTPTRERTGQFTIIGGITYSETRFWQVQQILEQEAKRHRHEAELAEGILEELHSL